LFSFGFNKFEKGALMLVKAGRVLTVLKYDFSQVCEPSRSGAFPWLKENYACSKSRTRPQTDLVEYRLHPA
jgi:hypothetical protein